MKKLFILIFIFQVSGHWVYSQSNFIPGSIVTLKGDTLAVLMKFRKAPLTWQHRLWGTGDMNADFNNGIFFYGDKATVFATDDRMVVLETGKDKQAQSQQIPADTMQEKHVSEFLNDVKTKNAGLISCRVEDAFRSTATVQLAMISYYTGASVKWDEDKMEFTNSPEGKALLKRYYRNNYDHP